MMLLDVAHQLQVPVERNVRIVPALQQDLHAAERLALVDLRADLLEREHVAAGVLGPAVEGAERAVGDADVGVVDVPIDDVRDGFVGMVAIPLRVGERAQLQQRRLVVQLEVVLELAAVAIDGGHHAAVRKLSDPSGTRPSLARRPKNSVSPARWR